MMKVMMKVLEIIMNFFEWNGMDKELAFHEIDIIASIKQCILKYQKEKTNNYDELIVKILHIAQNSEISELAGYLNFLEGHRDNNSPNDEDDSLLSSLCKINAIDFILEELTEEDKEIVIKYHRDKILK